MCSLIPTCYLLPDTQLQELILSSLTETFCFWSSSFLCPLLFYHASSNHNPWFLLLKSCMLHPSFFNPEKPCCTLYQQFSTCGSWPLWQTFISKNTCMMIHNHSKYIAFYICIICSLFTVLYLSDNTCDNNSHLTIVNEVVLFIPSLIADLVNIVYRPKNSSVWKLFLKLVLAKTTKPPCYSPFLFWFPIHLIMPPLPLHFFPLITDIMMSASPQSICDSRLGWKTLVDLNISSWLTQQEPHFFYEVTLPTDKDLCLLPWVPVFQPSRKPLVDDSEWAPEEWSVVMVGGDSCPRC